MSRTADMDRSPRRAGFTLMEILIVMLIFAVMAGIVGAQYTEYRDRVAADQASSVVGNYVALTRSYAVQARRNTVLDVDPTEHRLIIRMKGDTIRIKNLNLGSGGEFELDTLDLDAEGDTITFTPQGICAQCGMGGSGQIIVSARGVTYVVTFNAVGTWKKERRGEG